MRYDPDVVRSLRETYSIIEDDVILRSSEFREIWDSDDEKRALNELLFCILTPQSRAQVCWGAIEEMACTDVLFKGNYEEVLEAVRFVRFKYKKARYLIEARGRFMEGGNIHLLEFIRETGDPLKVRDRLVKDIKGLGYKEASHFLRNIGLGERMTILDRHILRILSRAEVIERVPTSMTNRRYLEIEQEMIRFAETVEIPVSHLDLVMWYKATGTIFK
ncbi:MAG: N-glycosylase/DNA lyase [Candidatus Thermoplasmatota archaeon]|nr:N-glycosylase/DNA lyase [Candidatus Thermoplasmatota archaeon]